MMKSLFKIAATRVAVFYGILIAASMLLIDYGAVRERLIIRTLNHNMPQSFAYFVKLGEGQLDGMSPDKSKLKDYVRYYEKVIQYMPQLPDAHGMLGFGYFYTGQMEKALKAYERAAILNPHFFYFSYNIGVIHFLREDYAQAAKFFEMARLKKADVALYFFRNGLEYRRALSSVTNLGDIVMSRLKSAYSECYRLLVISHLKQGQYREAIGFAKEAIDLGLGEQKIFYYYAGVAAHHMGDHEASIQLLQQAIRIDPDYPESYHYLSLNLKALGRADLAEAAEAKFHHLLKMQKNKTPADTQAYLRII